MAGMTGDRVYVGNLNPRATERDLHDFFDGFGRINKLWVARKPPGFAFVEFHNPAEAAAAIEQTNGYKLDKAHVFKVSKFDDFSKYDAVPDTYKAPEPKPYVARENTASYMLDDRGRDLFTRNTRLTGTLETCEQVGIQRDIVRGPVHVAVFFYTCIVCFRGHV